MKALRITNRHAQQAYGVYMESAPLCFFIPSLYTGACVALTAQQAENPTRTEL